LLSSKSCRRAQNTNLKKEFEACRQAKKQGNSFDACELKTTKGRVKLGALICAEREFPQASTQLMLNGVEIILVANACDWDINRAAQLRTRAFDNLAGIAMAHYPKPKNNGHSCAYDCVAWDKSGKAKDTLIFEAGKKECVYSATFNLEAIRKFKQEEKWRLEYQKKNPF
jgi:predicted amidohydrolase